MRGWPGVEDRGGVGVRGERFHRKLPEHRSSSCAVGVSRVSSQKLVQRPSVSIGD